MMQVARKLSKESWDTVKRILMERLVLGDADGEAELDPHWDASKVRREIRGNLSVIAEQDVF